MPEVRPQVHRGGKPRGGVVKGYPIEQIYREVAFISYYFHWSLEEIMAIDHKERRRWCEEISRINERINEEARSIT